MDEFQLSLPGPTECDPEVLQELSRPNLPHYGDAWMEIHRQLIQRLRQVSRTKGSLYVIPGSGSAGLDAVFTSIGRQAGSHAQQRDVRGQAGHHRFATPFIM